MSDRPTLNSKLRVLIAKAHKGERLYSSMNSARNLPRREVITNGKREEVVSIGELANEVRATVWHQAYQQLRRMLNEIVSSGSSSIIPKQVVEVLNHYRISANHSLKAIENCKTELLAIIKRDEFAHALKINLELVKHKALAQVSNVIADELASVIQTTQKELPPLHNFSGHSFSDLSFNNSIELSSPVIEEENFAPNVIPLRRNSGSFRRQAR